MSLSATPRAQAPPTRPHPAAAVAPAPLDAAEPQPAPPPPKPSPFIFALHGFVSAGLYLQDAVFASGQGGAAIFGPDQLSSDRWFLGGDVRQTQLKFTVRGPEVLAGAMPSGVVELDLFGGRRFGTAPGDDAVLPGLRLAYAELNWGGGMDMVRVGQQHNLLLLIIPASASHIAFPLGYGAGQLGWRAPGVTYFHKFALKSELNLDAHVQISRNGFIDDLPACATGAGPPTTGPCLPGGIGVGEASGLPQVEARAVLSRGKTPSPWPYYPANDFMVYAVGHWDQKDLSGVGSTAPIRDTMTTLVGELGFKVAIGRFIAAGNAWYGRNAGGVFGHVLQMQLPGAPRVTGFGVWGQVGLRLTGELSVWAFSGVDQPNESQAKRASFARLRNVQAAWQIAYKDGPYALAFELLHIWTKNYVLASGATTILEGTQPMVTVDYFF